MGTSDCYQPARPRLRLGCGEAAAGAFEVDGVVDRLVGLEPGVEVGQSRFEDGERL